MSDDLVYSSKVIKNCTVDFLPNEVLFALGYGDRVKCASMWISELQKEVKTLKKLGKDIADEKTKISHENYRAVKEENEKYKKFFDFIIDRKNNGWVFTHDQMIIFNQIIKELEGKNE